MSKLKIVNHEGKNFGIVGTPTGYVFEGREVHVGDIFKDYLGCNQFVCYLEELGFFLMGSASWGLSVFNKKGIELIKSYDKVTIRDSVHPFVLIEEVLEVVEPKTIAASVWNNSVKELLAYSDEFFDEEVVETLKEVLSNVPMNVVPDTIDKVLSKEYHTHLDATHVGGDDNAAFYYCSEINKKWYWYNRDDTWVECVWGYTDNENLIPVTIHKEHS